MSTLLRLQTIFRDVLDDDELVLTEEFSQADSEDWDSVATVQIALAVEENFGVNLPTQLVGNLTSVRQLLDHLPE
ncbi:acyl carrier protein [Puniceicoccus vermicola]|uniref:Acyl carrier protein n=1 Tax=Puniceicoccus vermicola TaxID=388746 RepID=A0A7X1AWH0_9BACT|nr:acyl carrier protein [Puniceicoccus vermicola]MBC2601212.1 acyl carrier protein [Puniceicoccus vermicola]